MGALLCHPTTCEFSFRPYVGHPFIGRVRHAPLAELVQLVPKCALSLGLVGVSPGSLHGGHVTCGHVLLCGAIHVGCASVAWGVSSLFKSCRRRGRVTWACGVTLWGIVSLALGIFHCPDWSLLGSWIFAVLFLLSPAQPGKGERVSPLSYPCSVNQVP